MIYYGGHAVHGFGLGSTYGDSLAAVGLHPDNPDGMYGDLMKSISDPVGFKNAQKGWHGARDAKIWWEDPPGSGIAKLQWPFHWGKWMQAAPKNDAQLRAVFKIPSAASTDAFLRQLYKLPASFKSWKMPQESWEGHGFDLIKDVVSPVVTWAEKNPIVKWISKAEVDAALDALNVIINIFIPSPFNDMLHAMAGIAADTVKRAFDNLSPKPIREIIESLLGGLHFLGDAGTIIRMLVDVMFGLHGKVNADTFEQLLGALNGTSEPPPGLDQKGKDALSATKTLVTTLDPGLADKLPSIGRSIIDLATHGKVRRSDLHKLLGNNEILNKLTDFLGVNDEPAIAAAKNIAASASADVQRAAAKAASAAALAAATAPVGQKHEIAQQAATRAISAHLPAHVAKTVLTPGFGREMRFEHEMRRPMQGKYAPYPR